MANREAVLKEAIADPGVVAILDDASLSTYQKYWQMMVLQPKVAQEYYDRCETQQNINLAQCILQTGRVGYSQTTLSQSLAKNFFSSDKSIAGPHFHKVACLLNTCSPYPGRHNSSGDKLEASHLCQNNCCVKPSHLKWETRRGTFSLWPWIVRFHFLIFLNSLTK